MKEWDRLLWGVKFTGSLRDDRPMIIGETWDRQRCSRSIFVGEPSRALLFMTRKQAREWCRTMLAENAKRPETDIMRKWRYQAIKVRERVTVGKTSGKGG